MKERKLTKEALTSALIYADALAEACAKVRPPVADPVRALVETDAYPRLMKISEVEFAIGWLHGCAETLGVTVEELWEALTMDARGLLPTSSPAKRAALKDAWRAARKKGAA